MAKSVRFKPIKKQIYVRKCYTGEKRIAPDGREAHFIGDVAVTDLRGDYSPYYEIVAIADDCQLFVNENIGDIVRLPVWNPRYIREVVPDKTRVVRESAFIDGIAPPCTFKKEVVGE